MMRALAQYVMQGRKQAVITALLFTFIPFLGWLGTAIMALVTLRKSSQEGAIVLLWLALPCVVLAMFGTTQPLIEDVIYGYVFTWLLAVSLRQTVSWSVVLQIAALIGVVAVALIHILYPDVAIMWEKMMLAVFHQLQKDGWLTAFKLDEIKPSVNRWRI